MNEKPRLLEAPRMWMVYRRETNRKTRQLVQLVEVFVDDGPPIIFVECVSFAPHPTQKEVLEVARQAYFLNATRPLGDEYATNFGVVSYLYERE